MTRILRSAVRSLAVSPLRSLLTTLGIVIGVSAVIEIVAVGDGCTRLVIKSFQSIGSNRVIVVPGTKATSGARMLWSGAASLALTDGRSILSGCPSVEAQSEMIVDSASVVYGGSNWTTAIWGAGHQFTVVREWPVQNGVMYSEYDESHASKVCLLGQTPAQKLFGHSDPVGQSIRIKKIPFRVIGVLSVKGPSFLGADQDDVIVVPCTTLMKKVLGVGHFSWIQVRTRTPDLIDQAMEEIRTVLRRVHRIAPGGQDDFDLFSEKEVLQVIDSQRRTIIGFLLIAAILALLAGGVGIMNIMLVSVIERTREIGVRMAVGARGMDILWQFLVEAVLIAVLGGLLGIATGVGVSLGISYVLRWPARFTLAPALIAVGVSGLVGVVFGFVPAWKASRLDPIEALRRG